MDNTPDSDPLYYIRLEAGSLGYHAARNGRRYSTEELHDALADVCGIDLPLEPKQAKAAKRAYTEGRALWRRPSELAVTIRRSIGGDRNAYLHVIEEARRTGVTVRHDDEMVYGGYRHSWSSDSVEFLRAFAEAVRQQEEMR